MESFLRHEGSEIQIGPYEPVEEGNRATACKVINDQDIALLCETVGLDSSSIDHCQLQPLLQILAAGAAWTAMTGRVALEAVQVSCQFDFATPIAVGDTITAVAVAEGRTSHGTRTVRLISRNQRGERILDAVLEM